jgi:predicted transcriptional regulator
MILARRERQIMDIVYRRGRATAADVLADLEDPPSYSSVRAMLRHLESKGLVRHEQDGPRYVFMPVVEKAKARHSALRNVVKTFFDNSVPGAVAALLEARSLEPAEYERLSRLLDEARQRDSE